MFLLFLGSFRVGFWKLFLSSHYLVKQQIRQVSKAREPSGRKWLKNFLLTTGYADEYSNSIFSTCVRFVLVALRLNDHWHVGDRKLNTVWNTPNWFASPRPGEWSDLIWSWQGFSNDTFTKTLHDSGKALARMFPPRSPCRNAILED
jgi:hypothetical protein